jgi:hypothetical protein
MKLPHLELLEARAVGAGMSLFLLDLRLDRRVLLAQFLQMRVKAHPILLVTMNDRAK